MVPPSPRLAASFGSPQHSLFPLLRRIGPTLHKLRHTLVLVYAAMVVLAIAGASLALLSGPAVAMVLGSPMPLGAAGAHLTRLLAKVEQFAPGLGRLGDGYRLVPALLLLNAIVKGAAQTCQFTFLGRISLAVQQDLRQQMFACLLRAKPSFFERNRQGDLLSRFGQDLVTIEQAVFYGVGSLLRDSLAVVLLIAMLVIHDYKLSLVLLITVPLAVWPLQRFGRWLKGASRVSQRAQGELHSICHESLLGLQDIQLHQQEARQRAALDNAASRYIDAMQRSYLVRAARTPAMEILGAVVLGVGLVLLAKPGVTRPLEAAHYVTFLAGLIMVYDPLKKLGQMGEFIHAGAAASERIGAIIDAPELAAPSVVLQAKLSPFAHTLRFEDVSLRYFGQAALDNVSFEVRWGERVALVGPSGAGKSSLLRLLSRLETLDGGRILFDERDISSWPLDVLRAQLTVVSQEASLFAGSVADNIAFGRPQASRTEIVAAAREAGALHFIESLPHGFETELGERGLSLSGGQRQRLAIARAFLRACPLLLLDEATSQLDSDSEQQIQRALDRLSRKCTTLMVAHRLATVMVADRIVVLDAGRVVTTGTHAQLIEQPGFYARWAAQLSQQAHRRPESRPGADGVQPCA